MMPVKNNKTIIFFLVSLCSFLVFSCTTIENFTIKGKIFLEDPHSNSTDNDFDYIEGDSQITIRSGNVEITTDADGSFDLKGLTMEAVEVLLEASRPGYQTAYIKVDIEYFNDPDWTSKYGHYSLDVPIEFSIFYKPGEYNSVDFNNNTSYPYYHIFDLKDSKDEIYIFLLKEAEATSYDWNVFEYAD